MCSFCQSVPAITREWSGGSSVFRRTVQRLEKKVEGNCTMSSVKLNTKYLANYVNPDELTGIRHQVEASAKMLHEKSGLGSDFLGWLTLPTDYDKEEFARIQAAAKKIQKNSEVLVVIGIGGSYLGARAAIEFLKSPFYNNLKKDTPDIYYVGNNINPTYLNEVISICEGRDFSVNVISKSGTTTEPALAFRVFKQLVEKKYGKDGAKDHIFATTDKAKGTLKSLSDTEGYETFVVPDDVGGRYSVLTAVGLLPIAVAGFDIDKLVAGAADMEKACGSDVSFAENPAAIYAATRNELYRQGKKIEILVNFCPKLHYVSEWWKQLYGESEGKDNKGIFPASVDFSTDLHSMGQWIQEGERSIFETVISLDKVDHKLEVPSDEANLDGLNFLAGKRVDEVNKMAELGTQLAHVDGGVPNMRIVLPSLSEYNIGGLLYFFEKACGISGYLLGVNPFNQPGVEAYKKNMFALLNKPGYEEESKAIQSRL